MMPILFLLVLFSNFEAMRSLKISRQTYWHERHTVSRLHSWCLVLGIVMLSHCVWIKLKYFLFHFFFNSFMGFLCILLFFFYYKIKTEIRIHCEFKVLGLWRQAEWFNLPWIENIDMAFDIGVNYRWRSSGFYVFMNENIFCSFLYF